MLVRIGIHVGDVIHSGGDVLGDAVNVAARVQPLAEPGGVCITQQVVDQVERKVPHHMVKLGTHELKNIRYPVQVYKVVIPTGLSQKVRPSLDQRRVAILPFTNMSPDPNDRYFADGITEEVISTVSKIGELQVISRTSAMRYRDTTLPLTQIGEELSAGSIIEGSVRKAGNKVRITAQLIAVEGDRHVWSQSYDRDLTDVFAIQADIAERVADSLKVQLVSGEKRNLRKAATTDPEAHTLYLKGRFYWNERTEDGVKKALKYFQEAAKVDPNFAMAYSGMADSYSILSDYGWMPSAEALPLARTNAMEALELDDSLAEAHASLGLTLSNFFWDFDSAEREFKRAIELKPNYAPAHHWYSILLWYMRRYNESAERDRHALELDPYSPVLIMANANYLVVHGEGEVRREGLARLDALLQSNPNFLAAHLWKSFGHVFDSKYGDAIEDAKKYLEMDAGSWSSKLQLAWVYASAGEAAEASKILDEAMSASGKTDVSTTNIGWVLLTLGRKDEGYGWIKKAAEKRDPTILYFQAFPQNAEFLKDPRWAEIESLMGLTRN